MISRRAAISTDRSSHQGGAFRHEALFYDGAGEFVERTAPFIRDGMEADEAALVVVSAEKVELLRAALPGVIDTQVRFADMGELDRNPARIIPAWRDFVDAHGGAGRRCRGVGEPIWPGRTPDELVECERHEALLNLAFAEGPALWLACPYDTRALDPSVIDEAHRTHPVVWEQDRHRESGTFPGLAELTLPFDRPLPEPEGPVEEMGFVIEDLSDLRAFVASGAARGGLRAARTDDLVLAASEVASNSLRHGGGRGVARLWRQGEVVVCEIRDRGHLALPMAGRERPVPGQTSGFGLWLANQVCDLVQVRTFPTGSVVRLHVSRGIG